MSKKLIIWVTVSVVILAWVLQRQQTGQENERTQLNLEKSLETDLQLEMDKSASLFAHAMYQKRICELKADFNPVKVVQQSIAEKTAIPPDLNSELKMFSESLSFKVDYPEILFPKGEKLSPIEQSISSQLSLLAKELKVKVAELEQSMVLYSHPYFKNLEMSVLSIAERGCTLYYETNPEKDPALRKEIEATPTKSSIRDKTLELIGKRVAYKSICDFREKAANIDQAITDARTSRAFKTVVLEEMLTTINSLKFSPFLFGSSLFYQPTADERAWESDLNRLRSQFEKVRYQYWFTSTNSNLDKILIFVGELKDLAALGCSKLESLD